MKNTRPLLALHQLSLYNTGRMPPDQVIAAFAARQPVLDRIIADLAAEKPKSRAQHHLIVGQRGMGKTMLLARIAAELRTEPALNARFIPLIFAEEQYAVDRLSKFWLNCLDSLADAREQAGDAKAVVEIDATVARLTAGSASSVKEDQPLADDVYSAFAKAAQTSGQRPVLLVDNLQLVFERLPERQQHSLRELLMRPGAPILVGASPSPPPQTQDYGAAFYDHFKVHYLRPLEESEMRDLLLHLAEAAQRDDVRQRVLQHPARLKVLRHLTGGNPRTTLTLFFLYAEDFAPSVFGDLEGLLDRVTPLYKARFEELTTQQQVITSAIANHWDPVTASKLAQATGLPTGTISPQLDRLEKIGTIERVDLFDESSTGYQIAERFFNIWFLMRSASRRQRREVEFLTRFLESFYEPSDRIRLARHMMNEEHFSPDRYFMSEAVTVCDTDQCLDPAKGIPLQKQEFPDTTQLHEALFAAYDSNWGLSRDALAKALALRDGGFAAINTDDWLRASAVLIHLNYGAELIAFLEQRGDNLRLRPWVEALRALQIGDRRALQNIAPEIRVTAEVFYDGIERRLMKLPAKTCRRS
jgi:DNA-binding MarR family transcriptional regulator